MEVTKAGDRGRSRLGLAGAIAGLLPVLGLSVLLIVNTEHSEERWSWLALLPLIATPYGAALWAALAGGPALRGAIFLASALLALAETIFLSFGSGVGLVFFPAAILLFVAAFRELGRAGWRQGRTPALALGALAWAILVGAAGRAYFTSTDDERCWSFTEYADGRRVEERYPHVPGTPISSGPHGPDVVRSAVTCTSDIVTGREAAQGLAVLAASGLLLAGLAHADRRFAVANTS